MNDEIAAAPWYAAGLQFTCTQCGRCCGGAPGYVWISAEEIAALSRHLQMDEGTFRQSYTVTVEGRGVSLRERGPRDNYHCVFYSTESGCSVYALRPAQCRTWPFWDSNLKTPEAWADTCLACPGSGRGKLHQLEEIEEQRRVIKV